MFSNKFVQYILFSISEAPFIMLGYLNYQITMVRMTDFARFLDDLLWLNLYGPIYDFFASLVMVIIGFYDSSSVRWVRGLLWEVIHWLEGVTATQWLGFFAVLFFWPVILVLYIANSIINLFKVSEPTLSAIIEPLFQSIVSLISPDEIDIGKLITY